MDALRRPLIGLALFACSVGTFDEGGDEFAAHIAARTPDAGGVVPDEVRPLESLSHAQLDTLLRALDGDLDYPRLWRSAEARALLRDYRAVLEVARPEQMKAPAERLAFWLNAYTGLLLGGLAEIVARDGPHAAVSDNDFALFTRQIHRVAGFELTLEELEHIILRGDPQYPDIAGTPAARIEPLLAQHRLVFPEGRYDARVNLALSFGAIGFPPFPTQAWRAEGLEEALQGRCREVLDDTTIGASSLGVSVLFDWFERDFVNDAGSVRAFVGRCHSGDLDRLDFDNHLGFSWRVRW